MKKTIIASLIAIAATVMLAGCNVELGTGSTTKIQNATVGQQLIDLKKAKDDGAISDEEYQAQKARILNGKE